MTEKMEEALAVLPGVNIEITQPMEMRFNELMTGIKQDVAIKIYGEDLDLLTQQAEIIANLITPIEGVTEPIVEQVTGLPQIDRKSTRLTPVTNAHLVCRLLLETKTTRTTHTNHNNTK